jgi:site-specific recombinase XerD
MDCWAPTEHQLVNYFAFLLEIPLAAKSIYVHKSALCHFLSLKDSEFDHLFQSKKIIKVLKGGFNLSVPNKKILIWDVDVVLQLVRSWGVNEVLNSHFLFLKSLTLLTLASACRVSELSALSRSFIRDNKGCVFHFVSWKKNSKVNKSCLDLVIPFCPDISLYPLRCLFLYIKSTSSQAVRVDSLFITKSRPFHRPRPNTLAKHLKEVLQLAGVDLSSFSAHSFRSAASSKALTKGVSVTDILSQATWAKPSTFSRFYSKQIVKDNLFANKVLEL